MLAERNRRTKIGGRGYRTFLDSEVEQKPNAEKNPPVRGEKGVRWESIRRGGGDLVRGGNRLPSQRDQVQSKGELQDRHQ